jgi:hypothetical protein
MHLNYGDSEESTNEIIALDDHENETKSSDKYDSDSEDANSSSNAMPTPLLINKPKLDQFSQSTLISNKQQQQLNSIQSSSSSNGPSHMCKDCFRTFKDINNYKEHRFQEHQITDYPNIRKCSMCSYATLLKSKYDCHMRCHLNNKVIKCHRCDYSTINIRHMSRHERMHMISMNQSREPSKLSELHAISLKKSKDSMLAKSYLKKAKLKTAFKLLNNNNQQQQQQQQQHVLKNGSASYPLDGPARPQQSGVEDKSKPHLHQLNMLAMAAAASNHQASARAVEPREAGEHKSSNAINFEMIRSMILSQLEKKPNLSDEELIKSQLIALTSMKNGVKLESDEQPSSADNYQLKFNNSFGNNLSSRASNLITPPSSTSSASNSLAASPTGRKQSDTPHHHQILLPSYQICSPSTQDRYTPTQPAGNGPIQQEHMLLYQSNIESMLKMQSMAHAGPSPLIYSLLSNEMAAAAASSSYNPNSGYQKSFQVSPSVYHHQPVQHHKGLVGSSGQCGQNGPCKHKYELDKLRKNVLKLVYNLMPQLVSLFNLDADSLENNSNIDKLVDYLINYHNHNQASMNSGNLSYN